MKRVLVAMSGGVDSSVAAALLLAGGHHVVGATMKLWGGPSDSGCCSVGDVDDARRVAQQLGINHQVFNFSDDFERHVVGPYVDDHAAGRTPNPCVECNRHLKFDRFMERARRLGFDAIATGHHAQVEHHDGPGWVLRRGADTAKDQSYVLYMLSAADLPFVRLPVGSLTKVQVRAEAARLGLRTAGKPDSQDVCFITKGGRRAFLASRIPLRPARVVDENGAELGSVPSAEMVTVGQRRGLGPAVANRYVIDVDPAAGTVRVGPVQMLMVDRLVVAHPSWVTAEPGPGEPLEVQMSAHGQPVPARWLGDGRIGLDVAVRRPAAGQSVVLYRGDTVVGGGPAA